MPTQIPARWPVALVLFGFLLTGCTAEVHRYIRFPDFLHPGWANQQRRDAIEHDPYPLNDVGPEVVGGRPREYQQPVREVERARMFATRPLAVRPTATTPWPTSPAPVVTPPPVVTTPYPPASAQQPPFHFQQRSPY
jgi:hypothetical protein